MSYQRVFGRLVCCCDLAGCGRVWISESGDLPRRCAGCKSMQWNSADTAAKQMSGETRKDQAANDFSLQYQKDDYSQE